MLRKIGSMKIEEKIYSLRKLFVLATMLAWTSLQMFAISFKASAPPSVPMGEAFQLVYTIDAANGKDLRIPELPDFDELAGPFTSQSSNFQIINGKASSSVTVTYTYTLLPKKEGSFTIPAASIHHDKQRYTSNAVTIKVLPENSSANNAKAQQNQQSAGASMTDNLSSENIFVRVIPSKTKLYEQDHLLLTYKVYSSVDLVGFSNMKFPNFNGFLKQEIELPQKKQLTLENYNGRNYSTLVLYQVLLYPQQTGTINIEKADLEAVIRVRTKKQVRSIFDDFFDSYQDVKKSITTSPLKISVDKLPEGKPANFSGAVGSFNFKSSLSSEKITVNDAITLKYEISGNGNMKLIKNPIVDFPSDFEVYDPKVNNNFKNTASGVSGSKTIEYLFIPRLAGDFVIPAYTFSYFDVNSKSYKEIKSPEYKIKVEKGDGTSNSAIISGAQFANQEQLKLIGSDIRYIHTNGIDVSKKGAFVFGTWIFFLSYLIPLLLAIALFVIFRKQIKANADMLSMKNKKANKVAVKRLKTAKAYMQSNEQEKFYEEILRALWGYMSDKLSIPVASLSKENIVGELEKRKVAKADIDEFMQILSECEFARYSPNSDENAMDVVYDKTMIEISKLQESLK